mgnify:CR=1 FL=1|jgi:hypothetical protein
MTDNELIESFLWGDEELFEKIIENNKGYVYNLSHSIVKNAEDASPSARRIGEVPLQTGALRSWARN